MKIVRSPGPPRGFRFSEAVIAPVALRPLGLTAGPRATVAGRVLAGGPFRFEAVEAWLHDDEDRLIVFRSPLGHLSRWAVKQGAAVAAAVGDVLGRLSAPRTSFAGLALDRPRIMGIVNVTPDSFHDGGRYAAPDAAIKHGLDLVAAGADILDVGGESTRPGSAPVPEDEECRRVLPVIRALARQGALVSVDTRKAAVMARALDAGARIVNDVSALTGDGAMAVVAGSSASAVLMHMQGTPETMQQTPRYDHAPYEVYRFLGQRLAACRAAGIAPERLAVDPGIGFGKTTDHNLELLSALATLHGLGCTVLLGASRKRFIPRATGAADADDRLAGSLTTALIAAAQGVQIHRVHDVAETRQALDLWHKTTLTAP